MVTPGSEQESMTPGEHLSDLMLETMQLLSGHISTASASSGLTPMQAMLLHHLEDHQALPMTEIARKLHCDTSNATGLVDRLEQRELISRVTPAADRRVRAVELTESGRRVKRELDRRIRTENPALQQLTADEIEQLISLLTRILETSPPRSG